MPRLLTGLLCLTLAACASGRADRLAVCDGRHRRPANPNGSVLTAGPASTPQPASAAQPEPSAALSASYRPCRGLS